MKFKGKLLSLTLCAAMLVSVAACAGGGTSNPTAGRDAGADSPAGSAEGSGAQEKDYSEKMVITLASIQIEDGKDYTSGDDFVKEWSEAFNIEWEISSLTFDNWAERLRIWFNSDDLPDMSVWDYKHGEAANYVDQGLVKKLPDNWKQQWPHMAKAYSDAAINERVEEQFGGTYFMFRPVFSTNRPAEKLSPHTTAYLRNDWAQAAGVELKDAMKVSEIIAYARAVKEQDPGNVGANFYPIVVRTGNISSIVQFNNTYAGVGSGTPYYLGVDGEYHWGPADESTLVGLRLYNEMYRDGLLHPEFYTLQDPDDKAEYYMTGRSAMYLGEGMAAYMKRYKNYMAENLDVDFDEVGKIVTVIGEDGLYHNAVVNNFWGANVFSPHIEEAKLERILDMIDYSCTEEAQVKIRMGIEGVDYETQNGELVSLVDESVEISRKYAIHPVYGNLFILSDDFQFINPNFPQTYRDKTRELYKLREELSNSESLPAEADWKVEFHDSTALNLASMVYADEYASLIVKDGDVEDNWRAWVEEKMNLIQPVLDELNALT